MNWKCKLGFHDWCVSRETFGLWPSYYIDTLYQRSVGEELGVSFRTFSTPYGRDAVCRRCDKTDLSFAKIMTDLKKNLAADNARLASLEATTRQVFEK